MLVNDLAIGNTVSGPSGNLVIRGTVQSDQGGLLFVVDPETKLGALIQQGELIENDEWSLVTRLAPNGNALIESVGETDALKSEVARLTKLTDALVQQAATPADDRNESVQPVAVDPGNEPQLAEVPAPDPFRTGQDA